MARSYSLSRYPPSVTLTFAAFITTLPGAPFLLAALLLAGALMTAAVVTRPAATPAGRV